MNLKTILFIIVLSILGIVFASYFGGSILMSQVVKPFSQVKDMPDIGKDKREDTNITVRKFQDTEVSFVDANIEKDWIPWIIKQISILIGAVSLLVFGYAGFSLIIYGDTTEQFEKSVKMIVFGVAGIGLAAFSYTIIANLLYLFV